MDRVLVTGGNGVMGGWVTRYLVEHDIPTMVFDAGPPTWQTADFASSVTQVHGDIREADQVEAALADHSITRVIHLAALLDKGAEVDPARTVDVNNVGTATVLSAAERIGIRRVIAMSTKGVLGAFEGEYAHPTYRPVSEDYPVRPETMYEITKRLVEDLVRRYKRMGNVDAAAIRLANNWGPGRSEGTHAAKTTHTVLVEQALRGETVRWPQGGEQRADIIYYRDVAKGIVTACLADKLDHALYHVGTGRAVSLNEFGEAIRKVFGVDVEIGQGLDYFGTNLSHYCVFDISRARADFDYAPDFTLETALQNYAEFVTNVRSVYQAS
jgi:UDP-glucose 4-epimerase